MTRHTGSQSHGLLTRSQKPFAGTDEKLLREERFNYLIEQAKSSFMKESPGLLFHIMFLKKNILSSWAACTPSKLNFAELIRSPYPSSKNCLMLLSNPLMQNEHTSHIRRAIKTQHKWRQTSGHSPSQVAPTPSFPSFSEHLSRHFPPC